jgi:hypothetical protein
LIKIHEKDSIKIITSSVTNFCDSLGYCEYKIPFHIEGIKAKPTLETIQGTRAHIQEEKFEEEHFEFEPITEEQLSDISTNVEFKREKIFTNLLIPLQFSDDQVLVSLLGRTDKVFRNNQTLVVQDDKFPNKLEKYADRFEPYPSQILQALTYLNSLYSDKGYNDPESWFEIPHTEKSWIIQIRDKHNDNKPYKIFQGMQTREALEYLHYSIDRFARLVLGIEEFEHHNSAQKCRPCSFAPQCEFRIDTL